jgi:hypothetical protein
MFGPNDKCLYLYVVILTIIFLTCLFTLGLQYLSYDKSNKITMFNYFNPDITIQAIKEFDFKPNITIDYYKGNMPFLGLTGDIKLDCYSGLCQKYLKKICERERCYHSDDSEYFFNFFDKNKRRLSSCETYTYDCSFTEQTPEFKCSEECAKNGRYAYSCNSCSYIYDSEKGYCEQFSKYNLYINDSVYCQPSNIIFFWKELYYENISNLYSYAKDAVLKNETCPDGKRPCGILDKYGNKLCISKYEKCPINFIRMGNEPPDKDHSYTSIKVGNKTIYYSNDFVENGRIIKGLYSDSDINIIYNENCSILDTYNLSYFLNENIKLYKGQYISQNMKNNGKSYLKSCDFVVYNLNLNQLKYDYNIYQFSQKFDFNIYIKLKNKLSNEFFCSFFGCIYLLVYLFFSIWAMIYGKLNRSSLCCFWCFYNSNFDDNDIVDFIVFFIFLIPYNALSILSTIWSSINLNDLNESKKYQTSQSNLFDSLFLYHKMFILGNIVIYSLILFLFILSILIFFFKKAYNSNNINYTKLNDK